MEDNKTLKTVPGEALLSSESGGARAGRWAAGFQEDTALLRTGICMAAYLPDHIPQSLEATLLLSTTRGPKCTESQ